MSACPGPAWKRLNHYLVDVTPSPVFTRFNGPHDGVLRLVKVLGGVPVLGGIAAADMSATLAQA